MDCTADPSRCSYASAPPRVHHHRLFTMAKGERSKVSTSFSRTLMTAATYHLALYFFKYSGNGIWTMMLGFKNSYVMQNVRDDYRINTETSILLQK